MRVRALIIDDSSVVRRTVSNVLAAAGDIDVVATASEGPMGLRRIAELRPDVVTLDIEMPGMDGIETLKQIRRDNPLLPVIMYSTLTERGAGITFDALSLGAADYATKPSGARNREEAAAQVRDILLPLIRFWGTRTATRLRSPVPVAGKAAVVPRSLTHRDVRPIRLVTIGVSTGGPDALARLIPTLGDGLGAPVAVVQHMPPLFTAMLARRLDQLSSVAVTEAVDGEQAEIGHVYIAPGGRHLEVRRRGTGFTLALSDAAPENSCRPAVDVLFRTAALATEGQLLSVVLTGMGQDGTEGARLVRAAGGTVLAQDEESSVVWGMPGAVVRAGLANEILPLGQMGSAIRLRSNTGKVGKLVS